MEEERYKEYLKRKKKEKRKKKRKKCLHAAIVAVALVVAMIACSLLGASAYVMYTDSIEQEEETIAEETIEEEIETEEEDVSNGPILTDVSDIVEEAMPAVVSITSRTLVTSGIGSGTIVGENDTELLILTSYHVVEDCSSLYVTFCDDENVEGYIKNADEDVDIAIVAVLLSDIPEETYSQIDAIEMCMGEVEVGEGVIVIGDALGYGQSVVTGIISATSREITVDDSTISVLQTDAAINSGNSGGCVLNSSGQIIGISEAKISSSSVEGMCYAIPIAENYELIVSLMQ